MSGLFRLCWIWLCCFGFAVQCLRSFLGFLKEVYGFYKGAIRVVLEIRVLKRPASLFASFPVYLSRGMHGEELWIGGKGLVVRTLIISPRVAPFGILLEPYKALGSGYGVGGPAGPVLSVRLVTLHAPEFRSLLAVRVHRFRV